MKLKYIVVFVPDVEQQVNFYIEKLGFSLTGKMVLYQETAWPVLSSSIPGFMLIVAKRGPADIESMMVLQTDDCLNEYHVLRSKGVEFNKEPQYLPVGLVAEFIDPAGNKALLLEERVYETSNL